MSDFLNRDIFTWNVVQNAFLFSSQRCFSAFNSFNCNGPLRLSICHQMAVHKRTTMLAHCNLIQNTWLCSKQSSFFPFMHSPLVANWKTRWSIQLTWNFKTFDQFQAVASNEFWIFFHLIYNKELKNDQVLWCTVRKCTNLGSVVLKTILAEHLIYCLHCVHRTWAWDLSLQAVS